MFARLVARAPAPSRALGASGGLLLNYQSVLARSRSSSAPLIDAARALSSCTVARHTLISPSAPSLSERARYIQEAHTESRVLQANGTVEPQAKNVLASTQDVIALADEAAEEKNHRSFLFQDQARDAVQGNSQKPLGVWLIYFLMCSECIMLCMFFNSWWWEMASNSWLRGGCI
ncbi:unnamed protein product [Amoebophrya sp. A25]|nr:unnamed protein product [Amoebophrya sp. A25]|eukprot:GSA25T00014131001.1